MTGLQNVTFCSFTPFLHFLLKLAGTGGQEQGGTGPVKRVICGDDLNHI